AAGRSGVAEGAGIGVAFNNQRVRHFAQFLGQNLEKMLTRGSRRGISGDEEHTLFGFQQVDSQPFTRNAEDDVVADTLKLGHLAQSALDLLLNFADIATVNGEALAGIGNAGAEGTGIALGIAEIALD